MKFHDTIGPACGWRTFGSEIEPEWAGWRPYWRPTAVMPDGWPNIDSIRSAAASPSGPLGTVCVDSTTIPARFVHQFDGACLSFAFDSRANDRYVGENDYTQPATVKTLPSGKTVTHHRTKTYTVPGGSVLRPNRMGYAPSLGRIQTAGSAAGARGTEYRKITGRLIEAMAAAIRPGGWIIFEIKDTVTNSGRERVWTLDWILGYITGSGRPALAPRLTVGEVHAVPAPGFKNGANRDLRIPVTQIICLRVG